MNNDDVNLLFVIYNCEDVKNIEMFGAVKYSSVVVNVEVDSSPTHGFERCQGLINCVAENNTESGYSNCSELAECISSTNTGSGFESCNGLINCDASDNTECGYISCTDIDPSCTESGNGGTSCDIIPL